MNRPPTRPRPRSAPAGFTLIELLVVISVIALLIGILMPALGQARESSRRIKCLANVKGIGQGLMLYMEKSKGILPMVRPLHDPDPSATHLNDPSLLELLEEFIDAPLPRKLADDTYISTDPYKCPSDRGSKDQDGLYVGPAWQETGTSYEYAPGLFMLVAEMATVRDPAFAVTKAYENNRGWPVVVDFGEFHPQRRSSGEPKNALFFDDWRADWFPDITQEQKDRFFTDILKFGGIRG